MAAQVRREKCGCVGDLYVVDTYDRFAKRLSFSEQGPSAAGGSSFAGRAAGEEGGHSSSTSLFYIRFFTVFSSRLPPGGTCASWWEGRAGKGVPTIQTKERRCCARPSGHFSRLGSSSFWRAWI